MELRVTEKKAIEGLTESLKPIVTARLNTPISKIKPVDLADAVAAMLVRAYMEMGLNIDTNSQALTFIKDTLDKDLQGSKYSHLSVDLIGLFVSNGIRGQYGTFHGQLSTINIPNIFHWINSGLKSEDYKNSITAFNRRLDELEFGIEDKSSPVNPEGQKKVIAALREVAENLSIKQTTTFKKKIAEKSPRDQFIQDCMREFDRIYDKSPAMDRWETGDGIKNVKPFPTPKIEFEGKIVDLTEYLQIRLTQYDQGK